jgi:outer membrane protein assembly factor BamB
MNKRFLLPLFVFSLNLHSGTPSKSLNDLSWSQWRGPNRDGMVDAGSDWPKSISQDHLKQVWRKELSKGYPGPVVSETMVFTAESKGKSEIVKAFDRKTGEQKWETDWAGSMRVPFFAAKNGSWVRSTPAFDGKNLYVGGMRDYLVCLDAETGKVKWTADFPKRYKTPIPAFGFVCSPLVFGGHVFVQAGAGFVKLEKETGRSVWRTMTDNGGMHGSAFSSPTIATLHGKQQLVVQSRTTLAGVDIEDGKVLWKKDIKAYRGMNILTPTILGNSIMTSSYGGESLLFDISKNDNSFSITKKWDNNQQGYMSGPIVIDGHCYLHLRKQRITCIDLKTGETKWISGQSFGKYMSMVSNGKEILALDQKGILYRIAPNTEKLEILESREIADAETWAHLAVSGNQIFIRELNAIACYEW